ncbi:low temperature requirement protein A [Micromonospora sp. M12]
MELFFDLVYVFALTRISARAFEDLTQESGRAHGWGTITGAGKTLLLLLALWAVWQGTAWTTSRYDPYRVPLQTVVITALVCSMLMGWRFPGVQRDVADVRGGVRDRAVGPAVDPLDRVGRAPVPPVEGADGRGVRVQRVFWISGAMLSTNAQVVLWSAALAIEYLAARCGWPVPGLGRSRVSKWEIAGEHLAERYQQFFLVALGETILVAGFAYSAGPFEAGHVWAFAFAVATSILLWRIYVQRAGRILGQAVVKARHPATIGRSAADTHLLMVIGLAATAIGYELIIEHPLERIPGAWLAMVLGGPALFLAGRARMEYEVFARVSLPVDRPHGAGGVVGAAAVPARCGRDRRRVLVLATVAVVDARRAHGAAPEPAAPPF